MLQQANIGWVFYKDYYQRDINYHEGEDQRLKDHNEDEFRKVNRVLIKSKVDTDLLESFVLGKQQLELTTTYPGLLIGTGYTHETGCQGEYKMGFYFDHTTGMPVIPGSSVKGILANAFKHPNFIAFLMKEYVDKEIATDLIKKTVERWKTKIFEGDFKGSMYKRDVFHDAFFYRGILAPEKRKHKDRLLDTDFITPHDENPLKNPKPLMFLKVRGGVKLRCNFDLKPTPALKMKFKDGTTKLYPGLNSAEKLLLFEHILLHTGMGAKTNVGYGKFEEASKIFIAKADIGKLPEYSAQAIKQASKLNKSIEARIIKVEPGALVVSLLIEGQKVTETLRYGGAKEENLGQLALIKVPRPGKPNNQGKYNFQPAGFKQ